MYSSDSPLPLKDYCLEFIRESVKEAILESEESEPGKGGEKEKSARVLSNLSEAFLTANISEALLVSLSEEGRLTDPVMQEVFKVENSRLETVRIPDACQLTTKGLRVLRGHKISDLQVVGLTRVTINELIGCLGEWTLHQLRALNVAHSSFTSTTKFCVVVGLAKLRNLRTLDVSHTEFNHHGLEIVVEDLPFLQHLNISATRVKDLSPLRKCKARLKSLSMYNLRSSSGGCEEFVPILCDLPILVKLDISDDRDNPLDVLTPLHDCTMEILRRPENFAHLQFLDISGKEGIEVEELKQFILHKHRLGRSSALSFLGLVQTPVCFDEVFNVDGSEAYNHLTVTGNASEKQILESLQRYLNRPAYIQKTLCYLYNYTINYSEPRLDVIQLILPPMRKHAKVLGIQMAATACLYNLTKGKLGDKIHPKYLGNIVASTLRAMENFPNHQQLQKNTLLTLCSDRILQEVTFNRFKCTKLVLDSLVAFNEPSMNRMAVAICSILAAKISTSETSFLGAKPPYMQTLLDIVRTRVNQSQNEPDIMLKFTLSALWNLTDESPSTCAMFLEKGGMALYLEVLKTYSDHSAVETKVLGLLNNIAEVATLRTRLIEDQFVATLRSLLHSKQIDVSYFAAGIFAHLISDGLESWVCSQVPRQEVLNDLAGAVLNWKAPDMEMVAYRSFSPFLPLLGCYETPEVQLWAVWAIHHVISKNPKRYCEMLLEEETLKLFQDVICVANSDENKALIDICQQTLSVIRQEFPGRALATSCEMSPKELARANHVKLLFKERKNPKIYK